MQLKPFLASLVASKKNAVILTGAFSFLGGAAAGCAASIKFFQYKYELLAEQEIAEAKRFYSVLHKEGKLSSPITALENFVGQEGLKYAPSAHPALAPVVDDGSEESRALIERGEELADVLNTPLAEVVSVTETEAGIHVEVKPIERNVFADAKADPSWDWDAELALRSETVPYIIHHDEYMAGEKDYTQATLTYYSDDDILVDDRDQVVPDSDGTVGDINLTKFGHGSKDKNVLYIRNDAVELDFEICRSDGNFAEEVHGFLEHADRPGSRKNRRFRDDER